MWDEERWGRVLRAGAGGSAEPILRASGYRGAAGVLGRDGARDTPARLGRQGGERLGRGRSVVEADLRRERKRWRPVAQQAGWAQAMLFGVAGGRANRIGAQSRPDITVQGC
jgi:hypothetical protein